MYRSASTNRFSDDHFSYYSPSSPSSKVPTALRALSQVAANDQLPVYEPQSEAAKKEKTRAKFAEKAVHAIPFVLLLCGFILWMFSNPDVDVNGSLVAENIQGIASKGHLDSDGTGHLSLHMGDLQDTAKPRDTNTINISQNR